MRLVDHQNVDLAEQFCLVPNRLNAAKQDFCSRIPSANTGGVNAGWSLGPEAKELLVILGD